MSSGNSNSGQNPPTFSPTSFSDAIRALNLSPRQNPATYAPFHDAGSTSSLSSTASSSSSSTSDSPDGTLTPLPDYEPAPPLRSAAERYQYYEGVSQRLQHSIIKDWVPHVMSADEEAAYRIATQLRLKRIRHLEKKQELRDNARHSQALFIARLDYRIRLFRTFRVNDLPSEILTNIFRFVSWSAGSPEHNVRYRLALTSTCKHWRDVAISDPTMWNAIWCKDAPIFERSLTWFERSGGAPIDLRINDSADEPWTLAMARFFIDQVFTKLSQLRVFIVVLHEWDPILYIVDALRRVADENLPMILERLEIHRAGPAYVQYGDGFDDAFYRTPIPLFGGAAVPSFRILSMNGCHLDWTQSTASLRSLTTLDIRRVPLERAPNVFEFRAILRESPHLRKLVLDGAGPKWPTQPIQMLKPIPLAELKVLVLGDFSLPYGTFLLSQFSCPNVVDMTLMNLISEDYSAFYHMMTGKTPLLKSLTLYGAELPGKAPHARGSIIKWLESIPRVGFLRLKNIAPTYLSLLLYDSKQMEPCTSVVMATEKHPVLPNMKFLELHMLDADQMKAWIIAREAMGCKVQKIYVGAATATKIGAGGVAKLAQALPGAGNVFVMNHPGKPPEEQELTK